LKTFDDSSIPDMHYSWWSRSYDIYCFLL